MVLLLLCGVLLPRAGPEALRERAFLTEQRALLTGCLAIAVLSIGALVAQDGSATQARQAVWGSLTEYADAVAIDSPFREARDRFWDGKSGEPPLSDRSTPEGFIYPATHRHAAALEELRGSTAVVIGVVTSARSYLSQDKTTIYSEMTVAIGQVLRDRSGLALAAGSQIAVERAGGVIRQASGKLSIRGCRDESMPRRHGRYLFVLGYSGAASSMFPILGVYGLVNDRVYLLDSVEPTQIAGRRDSVALHMGYFLTEYALPTADFLDIVERMLRGDAK
jgi:hypothetical protein